MHCLLVHLAFISVSHSVLEHRLKTWGRQRVVVPVLHRDVNVNEFQVWDEQMLLNILTFHQCYRSFPALEADGWPMYHIQTVYPTVMRQNISQSKFDIVPDSKVNVRQCICGCAWWLSDDVSLEQLSSLLTGAISTCRRTLRLNIDALPLRRYSARNDVCDMTLWLRSGI